MPSCSIETQRTLTALIEAMEAEAAKTVPNGTDSRSERRRVLQAECEICLFGPTGEPVIVSDALTRNLTFLGLSVVATLARPVSVGRPVEAIVVAPDHTRKHIAGTAAFCREVDDGCHEIGISVKAAGNAPILMHDVGSARARYDWFAASLDTPE